MTTSTNYKIYTGIFDDETSADAAYKAALRRGYKPEDINIIMSEATKQKYAGSDLIINSDKNTKAIEGLALGGAIGGSTLGFVGAILALGSTIVVPGIDLIVAGPVAAAIVGAGIGSVTGGILGALIGAGIPEDRAEVYEAGINNGGILLGVNANNSHDIALLEDWKKINGRAIA